MRPGPNYASALDPRMDDTSDLEQNYRGVFDSQMGFGRAPAIRHDGPHEANLFDINAKYGDVVPLADVMARLS